MPSASPTTSPSSRWQLDVWVQVVPQALERVLSNTGSLSHSRGWREPGGKLKPLSQQPPQQTTPLAHLQGGCFAAGVYQRSTFGVGKYLYPQLLSNLRRRCAGRSRRHRGKATVWPPPAQHRASPPPRQRPRCWGVCGKIPSHTGRYRGSDGRRQNGTVGGINAGDRARWRVQRLHAVTQRGKTMPGDTGVAAIPSVQGWDSPYSSCHPGPIDVGLVSPQTGCSEHHGRISGHHRRCRSITTTPGPTTLLSPPSAGCPSMGPGARSGGRSVATSHSVGRVMVESMSCPARCSAGAAQGPRRHSCPHSERWGLQDFCRLSSLQQPQLLDSDDQDPPVGTPQPRGERRS